MTIADVAAGGGNYDAVVAEIAGLGGAILAMTACVQAREVHNQAIDVKDPTVPTDVMAQRESALRIFYADDVTGEIYHISIPGPDWDLVNLLPNTDIADPADEPLATMISQIESDALSPVGNAVSFLRAVQVGRNN